MATSAGCVVCGEDMTSPLLYVLVARIQMSKIGARSQRCLSLIRFDLLLLLRGWTVHPVAQWLRQLSGWSSGRRPESLHPAPASCIPSSNLRCSGRRHDAAAIFVTGSTRVIT